MSDRIGPESPFHLVAHRFVEPALGRFPTETGFGLIRTAEPPSPRHLQGDVTRDLETIALKCLEKSPIRRYPLATALAEDLRRYLDGRPIMARPVSSAERMAKWSRRHPWQAVSAMMGVVLILGAWAGTLAHNARLREEVRKTEREAQEARTQRARAEDQYRSARTAIQRMIARFDDPSLAGQPLAGSLGFRRAPVEDALAFYDGVIRDDGPVEPSIRSDKIKALGEAAHFQVMIELSLPVILDPEAWDEFDQGYDYIRGAARRIGRVVRRSGPGCPGSDRPYARVAPDCIRRDPRGGGPRLTLTACIIAKRRPWSGCYPCFTRDVIPTSGSPTPELSGMKMTSCGRP